MAGTTLTGQLIFSEAEPADDAEIRALLRRTPMGGQVAICFLQEPDYFAESNLLSGTHRTLVGRQNGRMVSIGSCSFRERFVNGAVRKVGYLKTLRLDPSVAGRFDILRRGYEAFRELVHVEAPEFLFTSIAADNTKALRFLERGLPGMPKYHFISDYTTLLIAVRDRSRVAESSAVELRKVAQLLNRSSMKNQLAPVWSAEELRSLEEAGLRREDFIVRGNDCMALWDQRSYRQTVIQAYSGISPYRRFFLNMLAGLAGYSGLPKPGEVLPLGFLSHCNTDMPESTFAEMLPEMLARAARRGLKFVVYGGCPADARLSYLKSRYVTQELRTKLYTVSWEKDPITFDNFDFYPEVALL